jgi:hypothetical protein
MSDGRIVSEINNFAPKVGGLFPAPNPTGGVFDRATITSEKIWRSSGVVPFKPRRMV